MPIQLHDSLKTAEKEKALPVSLHITELMVAFSSFNVFELSSVSLHITESMGPGSSLDLSEFQQIFWKLQDILQKDDPALK